MTTMHVPPHNQDAEASVLSSILIDNTKFMDVADIISAKDFYHTGHQVIFEAMNQLYEQKDPIDLVTLTNQLRVTTMLDKAGGATYLADTIDAAPIAASARYYAEIIKECSLRRQLIIRSHQISSLAQDQSNDIEQVIEDSHKGILAIDSQSDAEIYSLSDLMHDTMDRYEHLFKNKGLITGIPTGFGQLDAVLCGMQRSDLIVLAARPSMGKTALAIQVAQGSAMAGHKSLVFSLEQPKEQLIDRLFAAKTNMPTTVFRTGMWSNQNWQDIADGAGKLNDVPVYFDDRGGLTHREIRKAARLAKKRYDIDFIVIDHLQLVGGAGNKSRNDEIGVYTRQFKAMAKELKLPVMLLSQLSRKLEERGDKRPKLSDLRDSGNIEQDADVCLFIYRDDVYCDDPQNSPNKGTAEILIAKQRQGPVCKLDFLWSAKSTKFVQRYEAGECPV